MLNFEAGLERAEGDFAADVIADRDYRRPAQGEMIAIPNVRLVRPSIAAGRLLLFCVTSGVTFIERNSSTKSSVS
jgi:hypothetical protein